MKKSVKRILSFILTAVMAFALLPVISKPMVVKAVDADKTVASLSTDAIKDPSIPTDKDSLWSGNYVWYGTYNGNPVKYRVLDKEAEIYSKTTKTLLLDCDNILFSTEFDDDGNANPGTQFADDWEFSDLKKKINGDMFLEGKPGNVDNFTTMEKSAITESQIEGEEYKEKKSNITGPGSEFYNYYTGLSGEKIFVLDAADVINPQYGYTDFANPSSYEKRENRQKSYLNGDSGNWWLRTKGKGKFMVGDVQWDGSIRNAVVRDYTKGVSPAFNINHSSIIFSSLISGKVGDDGAEFKLTVVDKDMNVALASSENATISKSGIVTIPYTITGNNKDNATQVSVLILDHEWKAGNTEEANILYYGKLSNTGSFTTSGTGTFDFSDKKLDLEDWGTKYRVYILAENVKNGKYTDYASEPTELTLEPTYDKYTVSFDANGGVGSMNNKNSNYDGNVYLRTNTFTREGYTFIGWNTKEDGSGIPFSDNAIDDLASLGKNITLYAQWRKNTYTVVFDANGGSGTMNNQGREYDDGAKLSANTYSLEGKTFNGWNTKQDGSGVNYADCELANITSKDGTTITLYAQWTVDSFTITWKNYDGTVLETDGAVKAGETPVYDGATPVKPSDAQYSYIFTGWTPEISVVTGATTYTAKFDKTDKVDEPETEEPEGDYLDELRLMIAIAEEVGGEHVITWNKGDSLPLDIMQSLERNPQITVVFSYYYQGEDFEVVISGKNVKADPEVPWCGPLYLYSIYGNYTLGEKGIKSSGTYIVQAGDTLSALATKFNTTIKNLVALNNIKDPDYIVVGQEIVY